MNSIKLATAAALIAILASPSFAQVVRDKKTCEQAVADAREAAQAATVSARAKQEIEELIRISAHLCTQANFVYAESLLGIARGMAAQE